MSQLGTLEDLPLEYRNGLTSQNLVPLWPNLRAALPYNIPSRRTKPMVWRYSDIRPELLKAGELTPIEKAERRVLVLANPGLGLDNMQATPSIYIGMQLILPRETAPNHKHTPSAVRFVVEGEGGFTVVEGEKMPMEKGDLILTPSGLWHEHGHEGRAGRLARRARPADGLCARSFLRARWRAAESPQPARFLADPLSPRGARALRLAARAAPALSALPLSVERHARRAAGSRHGHRQGRCRSTCLCESRDGRRVSADPRLLRHYAAPGRNHPPRAALGLSRAACRGRRGAGCHRRHTADLGRTGHDGRAHPCAASKSRIARPRSPPTCSRSTMRRCRRSSGFFEEFG